MLIEQMRYRVEIKILARCGCLKWGLLVSALTQLQNDPFFGLLSFIETALAKCRSWRSLATACAFEVRHWLGRARVFPPQ